MRALILSAGLGERLRPLTLARAKPALEFLNMPMLAFPYFWLEPLDLSAVVFNTHYLPETIRHAAMHVVKPSTQLLFSDEEAILGSGGGIWNARFHLQWDADFAVANGDGVVTFAEPDALERMLRFHKSKGALATMLLCPLEGVGIRVPGVWLDKYDEVVNFGKAPTRENLDCLHYASFMFLSERIWKYLPEGSSNILYDVFMNAIAQGEKVYGHRVENMHWFETGNVGDFLSASRQCLELLKINNSYGQGLARMLERFAPQSQARSDRSRLRLIADAAQIAEPKALNGFQVIGENVQIERGARLENCVLLPGARIAGDQSLRNTVSV